MELWAVLIKKVSIIQMARSARSVHSGKDETGGPVKEYINIALYYWNLLFTKSVDNPVFNLSYSTLTHCQPWSLVKLAKNWSTIFQQNFQQPETVAEAVDRQMTVLEGEHKVALAVMQECRSFR